MLRLLLFNFLIMLLTVVQSSAQQYNFKRYSVEEGLPRSGVYCMLEDSRGFLWIGTEGGGLAKFDGRRFTTYTTENGVPDNTVRALFEDADGNIWIGTDGHGLSYYDGRKFRNISQKDGLSNNYIRCITQAKDGSIWVGTFGGGIDRVKLNKDSIQISYFNTEGPLKSNNVRACLTDASGILWFGTDNGLMSFDGNGWKQFDRTHGLPHDRILVLFEDASKTIWIGTENGVSKMTENGFRNYTEKDGLISDRIRAICQDDHQNMWFGTQEGVSRLNGKGFLSYTEKNGLSNERIRHIIKDRTGNMWFGTYFGGICRYTNEEFVHFTKADGIGSDQVLSVFHHPDGDIWVGTLEGVNELKLDSNGTYLVEPHPLGSELVDHSINTIVGLAKGVIWFGTDKGILIKEDKKVSWFEADGRPFNENVKSILFEPSGSVWIGSTEGATRFSKEGTEFQFDQYHSNPNINESEVSCFLRDKFDRIWIGYLKNTITIFDGTEFSQPDIPTTLGDVSAMVIGPQGHLWIATEGSGLFRCNANSKKLSKSDFEHFGIDEGLSSSDLHQLIFDNDGHLWVGTASGIDKLELNQQAKFISVTHYGRSEGFLGTETNENSNCLDKDGNIWVGTIRGVTKCDPKAQKVQQVEAKIHITSVQLGFEEVDWETSDHAEGIIGYFGLPKKLELPFSLNDLIISFSAIDLREPEKVKYQWKMNGYSDDWSLTDENESVTLSNIPSGSHTFMVRACNSEGVWNEQPAVFEFVVLPPFYFTWWFIVLASLLLIGLFLLVVKVRERRHLVEKKKLQGMVDERTIQLQYEKDRSDELLLNILPHETAEELKEKGFASVQQYDMVSVLFTDFVGFTNITEGISHKELVSSLDEHFRLFDGIMDKYGIEKIKTIGDAYMAAGGIPARNETNPLAVVAAGLEMIHHLQILNIEKQKKGETAWLLRLGIHTGSVISGVVGKNKFAFDIWGDAVNTAARMESSGEVMKVNVSGSTYAMIKDCFECTPRGKIKAKNKGEIEMFFVERLKPAFSESENGFVPNAAFLRLIHRQTENILEPI